MLKKLQERWSRGRELNSRPADYESAALPLSYLGFVGCSGLCRAPRCFCCFDCTQIRHCHFSFLRFYHEVMRLHCRGDALRCVHTKRGMVQVSAWGERLRQCPSAAEAEEGEASVCRDAWKVKLASQQGCNGWHQVFRDVMFGQKSPCATVLRTLCIMSLLVNR